MWSKWLGAVVALSAASVVQAACGPAAKPVFSCQTQKGGKQIEVCATPAVVHYSFGKPGNPPELALTVKRSQASTYQWEGIGRYMTYAVNIPNGATVYRVFQGMERGGDADGRNDEAGVEVMSEGKTLTRVRCKMATVKSFMEGIDLPPEP